MDSTKSPFKNEEEYRKFIERIDELENERKKVILRNFITLAELMGPFATYAISYHYLKNPSEAALIGACSGVVEFLVDKAVTDVKEIVDDAKRISMEKEKLNNYDFGNDWFTRSRKK